MRISSKLNIRTACCIRRARNQKVISQQEGHIFSDTEADDALRNEATLVHILSLYSEATVCDFRGGVILYTLTTQVIHYFWILF